MNCEPCRSWIAAAAADELPESRSAEFAEHVRECSPCREELWRVRVLLEAIDRGVVAAVSAEPSPDLIFRVRQRITETARRRSMWHARRVPVVACAVVLVAAASVWILRPRRGASRPFSTSSPTASPSVANHVARLGHDTVPEITVARQKPLVASARRAIARRPRRMSQEPEIIVPSGQMEAVRQLVKQVNDGQIDGKKLLAQMKAADQPLEIKPLVIAPLDAEPTGHSAVDPEQNFASGPLN